MSQSNSNPEFTCDAGMLRSQALFCGITSILHIKCERCRVIEVLVQVVEGLDIVKKIENTKTGRGDAPAEKVVISDAGEA